MTIEEYLEQFSKTYLQRESKLWYVRVPGQFPANSIELSEPGTIRDAVKFFVDWLGEGIPPGTEFWDKERRRI